MNVLMLMWLMRVCKQRNGSRCQMRFNWFKFDVSIIPVSVGVMTLMRHAPWRRMAHGKFLLQLSKNKILKKNYSQTKENCKPLCNFPWFGNVWERGNLHSSTYNFPRCGRESWEIGYLPPGDHTAELCRYAYPFSLFPRCAHTTENSCCTFPHWIMLQFSAVWCLDFPPSGARARPSRPPFFSSTQFRSVVP